jgi:excisionase family DNA binding protein
MSTMDKKQRAKTLLPTDLTPDQMDTFLRQMERFANQQTKLTSAGGEEVLLPEPLFDVLKRVAEALGSGRGVTVMPQETKLTTQQAADALGVSRPTLVKLLEADKIPFERVGRHRRVTFRDLNEYREQSKADRRAILQQMSREGQEAGLHELGPEDLPTRG